MQRRTFCAAALAAALVPGAALSALHLSEGKNFKVIKAPRPDKLTVQIFFAYTCPHCYDFEPIIESWAAAQPSDVAIKVVPVAWNEKYDRFVRMYYTIQALGLHDRLHRKFFSAVIVEDRRFDDDAALERWATANGEISADTWRNAYNSFGVRSHTARARQAWMAADIESTPCVVIDGKYETGPGMTGTHEAAVDAVQQLLDRARRER